MKKIIFLTGTRADFGKIKSLISILDSHHQFEVYVFVTGMHLQMEYGYTLLEIERCQFKNIHTFENHTHETTMDLTLAKTIEGLSSYCKKVIPDLIVVHGDRVETLAGAIVGSLNNILVAHIEGGELSGTVDELIRHSVSKLSHIHFVSNDDAAKRLLQMGEMESSIFTIGSPDIDIMFSDSLPDLEKVKRYYEIDFNDYAIVMFHPVTTEANEMQKFAKNFVISLLNDSHNYVVIYPNNDWGSQYILDEYYTLKKHPRFRVFPSLRFEYFLTLLKNAQYILGNSSVGIREAPYYGIPIINIGTRQQNRAIHANIINVDYDEQNITEALRTIDSHQVLQSNSDFGQGNSAQLFLESIKNQEIWAINHQKQFRDI
ncbi:UDP-N-acetylglucosamine 2-epimerase [Flavobacterium gawalongense]|uniref:UDP-N-acetylglucosamine 2-epimerase (Hydrolyzing) n=1 Tax=Flavobacterium gawalongense TaxID=2594432 RepID=A0A553BZA2_9FLAO|nr:UDP-N-acetylglucosamine 2-epimerase [Flavobacterium gawalongense]TRX13486.1 UDP-N-acetylglucosamine 2-epimerase (hydrolyzing) [Flavobacterium gawalongense]TRX15582.1 UDP-N-acetylglucosamine 2-epimerase (hydrolyzing) [Flavobacterium gawalongense]TRX31420.1 UDP-N-acetylglucosamine 2-epimerase (hydrolyzing) [Flavobacterium gawalongense]